MRAPWFLTLFPFAVSVAEPSYTQCETQILAPSDLAAGDRFGGAVDHSAELAVVGANRHDTAAGTDAGAVYVYGKQGAGWALVQKLTPADAAASDFLGVSVALSGDRILASASGDDGAASDAGSVYVFEEQGGVWVETAELTTSDAGPSDLLGRSIDLEGDRAVIGAPFHDGTGIGRGAAYVFEHQGGAWIQTAKLVPPPGTGLLQFGISVSLPAAAILVGAQLASQQAHEAGSAFVFQKLGPLWFQQAKLLAADPTVAAQFGGSVSLAGTRAVIGASNHDLGGGVSAGAVYVFEQSGAAWAQVAKLTASDAIAEDQFGSSVDQSGDLILVGDLGDDVGGFVSGSAYLFEKQGPTWVETAKLTSSDTAPSDVFGEAVSLAAGWALIGAPGPLAPGPDPGSATLFAVACDPAACAVRNGAGINPTDFACATPPILGTPWNATIALAPTAGGATLLTAVVFGFGGPTAGVLMDGFELLILPPYFYDFALGAHALPVPCNQSLVGAPLTAQGLRIEDVAGTPVTVLTNALDLVLGH